MQQRRRRRTAGPSRGACSTTRAADNAGAEPLGSVGAVVGATLATAGACDLGVNGPLLAPGWRPGRHAADLRRIFGAARGPCPAELSSRSVLASRTRRGAARSRRHGERRHEAHD